MTTIPALLLQDDANAALTGGLLAFAGTIFVVFMVFAVVLIVGVWKVFVKAGKPGWAVLVPFYNVYVLLQIAGRPGWWLLLFLIPLVNVGIAAVVAIDLAQAFGQGPVFGVVLLFLLGGVGYLVLGFGNYQYVGTRRTAAATA